METNSDELVSNFVALQKQVPHNEGESPVGDEEAIGEGGTPPSAEEEEKNGGLIEERPREESEDDSREKMDYEKGSGEDDQQAGVSPTSSGGVR